MAARKARQGTTEVYRPRERVGTTEVERPGQDVPEEWAEMLAGANLAARQLSGLPTGQSRRAPIEPQPYAPVDEMGYQQPPVGRLSIDDPGDVQALEWMSPEGVAVPTSSYQVPQEMTPAFVGPPTPPPTDYDIALGGGDAAHTIRRIAPGVPGQGYGWRPEYALYPDEVAPAKQRKARRGSSS